MGSSLETRSPFPGMDPYLEDPARWPDFHARFIAALGDAIAEQVAPNYLVRLDERVYVTDEAGEGERLIIPALGEEEHREVYLVIKLRDTLQVVTIIELLSPTNKRPQGAGRDEYLAKRRQILHSQTNLIELDFLREGARVPMARPLPSGDYFALVHRAARRPLCDVYPFTVRDRLPEIPIPLRGVDQVRTALQPVFDTCYARARYVLEIDYTHPAVPPLPESHAVWAAQLTAQR